MSGVFMAEKVVSLNSIISLTTIKKLSNMTSKGGSYVWDVA